MIGKNIIRTADRDEWRSWLSENWEKEKEAWFVFPMKGSGEKGLSYNDAVEEALCFGWVDSTVKNLDETHRIQRFTPRKKGSPYSRPNIERLMWLDERDMIHPKVREGIRDIIAEPYVFPEDILETLRADPDVWENFLGFSDSYRRIRIAYIDAARKRPDEFRKRLDNFVSKTKRNELIRGFGGIEKYY